LFGGAIDGPQIAAAALVLLGAFLLSERSEKRAPEPASTLSTHALEPPQERIGDSA
jgi:hypothetical protein